MNSHHKKGVGGKRGLLNKQFYFPYTTVYSSEQINHTLHKCPETYFVLYCPVNDSSKS